MLKKVQIIIVVTILILISMALITTWLLLNHQSNMLIEAIERSRNIQFEQIGEISNIISRNREGITVTFTIITVILILASLGISKILEKCILAPTMELVKNAEMIIRGESLEKKYLKADVEKDQVDELVSMIVEMDNNLKERLEETTRQKGEIETILLHMKDGVISFDIKGRISHINKAAKENIKIKEKDTFKTVCEKIGITQNLEKIIYMQKMTSQDKEIILDNRIYKVFFAPLKTEDEKAYGIVMLFTEITETVELDKMRKRFVADVSHELKTPITSILGYSETIIEENNQNTEKKENTDNEQTMYFVNKIHKEASRMAELVKDLLMLSKYDNNIELRNKEYFNLVDIVKELVEKFEHIGKEKNIKFKCYVTAEIPEIYGDKFGIERVIINIITNAIKYTGENRKYRYIYRILIQ